MWRQGGRSSALDRAEALLSSRRSREPARVTAPSAPAGKGWSVDLSDLSSVSSAPEHQDLPSPGPDLHTHRAPQVDRPESSLGGGANRFLKKSPATVTNQQKVSAVSSSLRASQTTALSRLAEIESRFGKGGQSKSLSKAGHKPEQKVTEEEPLVSGLSSHEPSPKRFVKKKSPATATEQELNSSEAPLPQRHPATPRPGSPFRYTGRAQDRFTSTPSHPSLSPSPPCLSPTPVPCLTPSPAPCLSPSVGSASVGSACGEVKSLEELFSAGAASEDDSSVSSGYFRINVMGLDELEPATLQLHEDTREEVPLTAAHRPETPNQPQSAPKRQEVELVEEEEEEYQSDFESVIQTETRSSLSPISEHIQGHEQPPSPPGTEYDYSSTFTCDTSEESHTPVREISPEPPLRHTTVLPPEGARDTGVQTHWGRHNLSLQPALTYSPSLEVLLDTLRQQLALTSHFISSSRDLHTRVLQSLEPPNYIYTTLKDTQKNIRQLRESGLSLEHDEKT